MQAAFASHVLVIHGTNTVACLSASCCWSTRKVELGVCRRQLPWESFQLDIRDLFVDKLSKSPAQSYWRTNSPTHFGGATGTFTAIEEVRTDPHRQPSQ